MDSLHLLQQGWPAVITALVLGLIFGSFNSLLSHRLIHGGPIVLGRSECPKCKARLGIRDLIPLISWLANRGRCRHCKTLVSIRYPLIEIAQAALFLLIAVSHGITPASLVLMLASVILLAMIVTDLETGILPDPLQLALIILAVAYHVLQGTLDGEKGVALLMGITLGCLLHYGYYYIRGRHGLGLGDVKFLAVAGLWIGLSPFPIFLFLSGLLGIFTALLWRISGRGKIFPFGPALCLSLFCCINYPILTHIFFNFLQDMRLALF